MKTTDLTISEFVKVPLLRQRELLQTYALLIDTYEDGGRQVNLYFYNHFFVEETSMYGNVVEIIPFRRGFTIPSALRVASNALKMTRNDFNLAPCR